MQALEVAPNTGKNTMVEVTTTAELNTTPETLSTAESTVPLYKATYQGVPVWELRCKGMDTVR
jgi:hypothetical protein